MKANLIDSTFSEIRNRYKNTPVDVLFQKIEGIKNRISKINTYSASIKMKMDERMQSMNFDAILKYKNRIKLFEKLIKDRVSPL
jgi:hypothetical protein